MHHKLGGFLYTHTLRHTHTHTHTQNAGSITQGPRFHLPLYKTKIKGVLSYPPKYFPPPKENHQE